MKRGSSKKMSMDSLSVLLRNRNVLYLVLFAAIASLFNFLMRKQLDAVAFFIIIGFITSYFSKNMIIILLTSILSTFFLVQIKMLGGRVQEGMDGEEAEESSEEDEDTKEGMDGVEDEEEEDEAAAALAALTKSDTEGFRMRRLRK